ncbi:MAG: type IV pilus assembly protein PilM [Planctomycetes bacterium]|nr:type IV pilus assembly protein PilM [Planctomycetota bacterium]
MAKPKQRGVWGLDIGQCALKALRLEDIDGQLTATAFDYVEHPKILSQPDADPEQLTREALETFLSRNKLDGDLVAISVPGQSGLARFVKLPPVEEKKIPEIVRFEAKQQIPFPLDEVIWDFQKIGSGAVAEGFSMETEIGLFAMKRDMINRALQQFKDLNIEVHIVQMAPLALCNYVSYDLLKKGAGETGEGAEEPAEEDEEDTYKKRCIVALDLGTDSSNLVITDAERIIWQRPIPQGGNHFTRALTKDLKLTFAKAEHIKRNATKSQDLKKILSSLKPVLTDFVGEVQRSLGYFTNTHRDAKVMYMVGLGNGFRLPGLQKFLTEKLQLEVRKLQKLERLEGEESVLTAPAFTQNVLSFAVAYGLALQGLKKARLQTNLLPPEIQFERMVRAKKPWAVTAAACLLVGAGALAVGYGLQYRAVASPAIQQAETQAGTVVSQASNMTSQYNTKLAEVQKNEAAVTSIVAGQKERTDWLLLTQYVDNCLPVPAKRLQGVFQGFATGGQKGNITNLLGKEQTFPLGPGTLLFVQPAQGALQPVAANQLKPGTSIVAVFQSDATVLPYWTPAAQQAYLNYYARLTGDTTGDPTGMDSLTQINLENMDARWADNLRTYFDTLTAAAKNLGGDLTSLGMIKEDRDNPPEGAGWVIELRGYTYNKASRQFLVDTLLKNLQIKANPNKLLRSSGSAAVGPTTGGGPPGTPPAPPGSSAAGGGSPPTTPAAAGAGTAPADTDSLDPYDRVIRNKISHGVLYQYWVDNNPDPGFQFKLIGGSPLAGLVAGGGAAGAGAGGSGGPSPGGSGGPSGASGAAGAGAAWVPLTSGAQGAAAGAGGMSRPASGGSGGGGTLPNPFATRPGGSAGAAPGSSGGASSGTAGTGPPVVVVPRTEFIILFVWKEPTPSDERLAATAAAAGASAAAGGGGLPNPFAGRTGASGNP